MASRARARSTCAAGALSERLRRVSSWRSSAVSGRRGSCWWRDMGHLGARGSPHHHTRSHGKRPTRMEESSFNPFRDRRADEGANVRLAIARNLAPIYAEVLDDPLPEDLRILIEKWEGRESARQG